MDTSNPLSPAFAHKVFDLSDQRRFADLSGDVNPMHMDPVAARRLLAGQPVVHGMHLLLHALDRWPGGTGELPSQITADFSNPVCVGDSVAFEINLEPDTAAIDKTLLRARVGSQYCSHFEILSGPGQPTTATTAATATATATAQLAAQVHEPLSQAQEIVDPQSWKGRSHLVALPRASAQTAFPRASAWLGERRVAALCLLSYYVGMVCPGLHSIFSSLRLRPGANDADTTSLRFEVQRFDPRFPLYVIRFAGCIEGEIRAFVRARPHQQAGMAELLGLVDPDEFVGTHAWVIGGSRGLGELTAKIIAAGGGEAMITYAAGADDAQRVAADINAARRGKATVAALDLRTTQVGEWVARQTAPDAVFYFATGRIFKRRATLFDRAAFEEFNAFYIDHFQALCTALESLGRPVQVFYPSTVFVSDRPRGMTEYAMSKAAAEVLIDEWNKGSRHVKVVLNRLQRLATDQTATALPSDLGSNLDALLPLVRQTFGRAR